MFTKRSISGQYYIEGLTPKVTQEYLVARTLVTARDKCTFCRVINLSDVPIVLYKLTKLVKLVPLTDNRVVLCKNDTNTKQLFHTLMNINDINTLMSNEVTFQSENRMSRSPRTVEQLGLKIGDADLTQAEKEAAIELLNKNADLFAVSLAELPGTHLCEYEIDTGDAKPINSGPYRLSPAAQEILDDEMPK